MVRPSCLLFGRLGPKKKTLTECHAPNSVSLIWFVGTKLVKDRVFSRTMPKQSIRQGGRGVLAKSEAFSGLKSQKKKNIILFRKLRAPFKKPLEYE